MTDEEIDGLPETELRAEAKSLERKRRQLVRELSDERRRCANREQQILDLGRLLVKHRIDWRKEAVWTDSTAAAPP